MQHIESVMFSVKQTLASSIVEAVKAQRFVLAGVCGYATYCQLQQYLAVWQCFAVCWGVTKCDGDSETATDSVVGRLLTSMNEPHCNTMSLVLWLFDNKNVFA